MNFVSSSNTLRRFRALLNIGALIVSLECAFSRSSSKALRKSFMWLNLRRPDEAAKVELGLLYAKKTSVCKSLDLNSCPSKESESS